MQKPCPICSTSKSEIDRILNQTELLKCQNCGFVFANLDSQAIFEANSLYGTQLTEMYEEKQTMIDMLWFHNIAERFTKELGPGKVLDVGCGNGVLLSHFIDLGWDAYGVDISPWAEKFSKELGFSLYPTTLEEANIPPNTFDLVLSTSTFEHIEFPVEHVKAILEVLKPEGVAYFSGMPNYGKLTRGLKIAYKYNIPPGHVNYFTVKSLRALFNLPDIHGNLKNVSIRTYGIPDAYIYYQFFWRIFQGIIKLFGKKSKELELNSLPKANNKHQKKISSKVLITLMKINFRFGRLFGLGDKLEVQIVRNFE